MIRSLIWSIVISLIAHSLCADDYIDKVNLGNEAARSGDFKKALENYHIAETEIPESPELDYNIGGALLGQQSYEEAVEKYTKALNSDNIKVEADAHYNLGTTYYRMGDYAKAIESFQSSLKLNPDDMDAKFNLELARKMLKEQMNQQDQEGDQQQQQEQQKKQEQEQQEKEKQDKPEEKPPGEDEEQQEKEDGDQSTDGENKDQPDTTGQQQAVEEKAMSKEDAERILNALRDDEKEVQKKVKRAQVPRGYSGKDY